MKKLFSVSVLSVLLLSGCIAPDQPPEDMGPPPEEVLRSAVTASQLLESASIRAEAQLRSVDFSGEAITGNLTMEGEMADSGNALALDVDVQFTSAASEDGSALQADFQVIVLDQDEVYLWLESLTSDGPFQFFDPQLVQNFVGTWWYMPPESEAENARIAPDPRLLHAQASIVSVTENHGADVIGTTHVYRYGVSIDPDKLSQYLMQMSEQNGQPPPTEEEIAAFPVLGSTGELWIDAQTGYIHRLKWRLPNIPSVLGQSLTMDLSVDISDHNGQHTITPPPAYETFSPTRMFGTTGTTLEAFPDDRIVDSFTQPASTTP